MSNSSLSVFSSTRIRLAVLLILTLCGSAVEANAKAGIPIPVTYGYYESLDFIGKTTIPDGGSGTLSLCKLVKTWHVVWLPIGASAEGYALAENGCHTDSYRTLPAEKLKTGQEIGFFDKDLPTDPSLNAIEIFYGFLVWFILAGIVLTYILVRHLIRRRTPVDRTSLDTPEEIERALAEREATLAPLNGFQRKLMLALAHTARLAGPTDKRDAEIILAVAGLGHEIPTSAISAIIESVNPKLRKYDIENAFADTPRVEALEIIRSLLIMVFMNDDNKHLKERHISHIIAKLGLTAEDVNGLIKSMKENAK